MRNMAYMGTSATLYQMYQWLVAEDTPPTRREGLQVCVCKKCNEQNEYAEPNQPDGSYLCVSCRRYQKPW